MVVCESTLYLVSVRGGRVGGVNSLPLGGLHVSTSLDSNSVSHKTVWSSGLDSVTLTGQSQMRMYVGITRSGRMNLSSHDVVAREGSSGVCLLPRLDEAVAPPGMYKINTNIVINYNDKGN